MAGEEGGRAGWKAGFGTGTTHVCMGLVTSNAAYTSAAHNQFAADPQHHTRRPCPYSCVCSTLQHPRHPAILQVGADEKLSSVIDGESLVNDGSALVIFLVLQQIVQGAHLTVAQVGWARCCTCCRAAASLWQQASSRMPLGRVQPPCSKSCACACLSTCLPDGLFALLCCRSRCPLCTWPFWVLRWG